MDAGNLNYENVALVSDLRSRGYLRRDVGGAGPDRMSDVGQRLESLTRTFEARILVVLPSVYLPAFDAKFALV